MSSSQNRSTAKILVVEDDGFLSRIYVSKLEREGFTVTLLENGVEAVKTARQFRPNVIILDIIMPMQNGFQTLSELKSELDTKDIPVLILTDLQVEEDRDKVLAAGAADYLLKTDLSFAEVIEKIRELI